MRRTTRRNITQRDSLDTQSDIRHSNMSQGQGSTKWSTSKWQNNNKEAEQMLEEQVGPFVETLESGVSKLGWLINMQPV